MSTNATSLPRLPVFGWDSLAGPKSAGMSCMLDREALVYTTSGRASLLLALETLGVGPGDRVLLPSYHCPTMVAPAVERQASPLIYPVDEAGTPMLAWLDSQDLSGVRAMIAAHYFGIPQPMGLVRAWCDRRGIALIEDCAHALFGRSGDRDIGRWGDLAIGSLPKFMPVPEGGCLALNNGAAAPSFRPSGLALDVKAAVHIVEGGVDHRRLAGLNGIVGGALSALRRLRGRGIEAGAAVDPEDAQPGSTGAIDADFTIDSALAHRRLTGPSRWVAAGLPRERIVKRRRERYAELAERLRVPGMRPLLPSLPPLCAPYVFPLWVDTPDPGYAEMRRRKVPVFRWDRVWPGTPELAGDHGLLWSHHVLQLACHQDLPEDSIGHYAQTIVELFGRR